MNAVDNADQMAVIGPIELVIAAPARVAVGLRAMRGKLIRIASDHTELRTDEVPGEFLYPPVVGRSFRIQGPPLNPNAVFRQVTTSIVQSVEEIENGWRFRTLNSLYELLREGVGEEEGAECQNCET